MSRTAAWSLALLGLALLTFVCVRHHGPDIEADLRARTEAALGADALATVDVALAGRDVILAGLADSDEARAEIVARVAGVRGVRAVDDRMRRVGEAAPSAFRLTDGAGGLVVAGAVPDVSARERLLARVAEAFPGRPVADSLVVTAGADAEWLPAALGVLGVLGASPPDRPTDASLAAEPDGDGGTLVLGGQISTAEARARLETAAQAAIGAPWRLRSDLTAGGAPAAGVDPDSAGTRVESAAPGNADVAAAQAELQALFMPRAEDGQGSGAVEFETGTSRLTDDSRDLLTQASGVLRRFDGVTVEIQGHTDDEGSAASNLRLSEQRADAVRRYLADAGVDRVRLTVRGLGEAEPIASNDTEAGRARNRRVVFRLGAE